MKAFKEKKLSKKNSISPIENNLNIDPLNIEENTDEMKVTEENSFIEPP